MTSKNSESTTKVRKPRAKKTPTPNTAHTSSTSNPVNFPMVGKPINKPKPGESFNDKISLLMKILEREQNDLPSLDRSTYWKQVANPTLTEFRSNEKTGKWCLNFPKEEIDAAWDKVKQACNNGDLLLAKCSTAMSSGTPQYPDFLICVYTLDWSDSEDLQKAREVLRNLGFTQPIKYKRDLETINRVYGTEDEFYIVE